MGDEENQVEPPARDRERGPASDDLNVSLYWPADSTDPPQPIRSEAARRPRREDPDGGSQDVGRTAAIQASLRTLGGRIDAVGRRIEDLVTASEEQRHLTESLRDQLETGRPASEPDLGAVLEALARIEEVAEALAESQAEPDLAPVQDALARLEQRPAPTAIDLTPLHETLGRLEQRPTPAATDLTPVLESLARLEELAEALAESQSEPTDPSAALRELTQTVQRGTEQAVDRTALEDAVARIEHRLDQHRQPGIDEAVLEKLAALGAQLDAVGERISSRERPMAALDPATIDALADAVATRLRSRSGRPDRPLRGAQPGHPEG